MPAFNDHFSGHAESYRASRPSWPDAWFDWLASNAPGNALAVDLGCGNGQATLGLAGRFALVHGLDPSAEQIAQAPPHPRVRWTVAPAEATGLPDGCADLVVAAQAFHWFDHARSFPELRRMARPGALFAAATYGHCAVTPAVDAVVRRLYADVVGPWWPPERRHVEDGYRSLPFPLPELAAPPFQLEARWDLARLRGYLGSWSAVQAFTRERGTDPLAQVDADLAAAWGDAAAERVVRWPVAMRAGRR